MNIVLENNNLTEFEKKNIVSEIQTDLVDHLYKSSPAGIISAGVVSLCFFIFSYLFKVQEFYTLFAWYLGFNTIIFLAAILYLSYKKYRNALKTSTWTILLSAVMILVSAFYGTFVFFLPDPLSKQFVVIAALMMIATGLSTATIGIFKLAIVTTALILGPLIIWLFLKPDFFYKAGGVFLIIYYLFLLGMNLRITIWLKNSLRLKTETSFFTYQANHDILTDLPNQRSLLKYMETFIADAKESKENFIAISFSVNRLEIFNNGLGYQAGDLIIQSIAKRFRSLISEANYHDRNRVNRILTLPRQNAFTILVGPISESNIELEVKRYHTVLEFPFYLGDKEATLTASVGVSVYPKDGESPQTLLTNAHAAMFQAKQHGGNYIEFYKQTINAKTPHMIELENDLFSALEKKEFVVYYQPIIDLSNGYIHGMEALIRWQHPKIGFVMPGDFIPLATENGLIIPLGAAILQDACKQTEEWQHSGYPVPIRVSVNLAAKQLRNELITEVKSALSQSKLDSSCLDLEITETDMLDERISPIIQELTKHNITFSIDDFGTGYSGLSYLKYFKVNKIKIDRSFIHNIHENEESAMIVSAIIAMAKELNIKTLAEGVETKSELDFLIERGCNFAQGYYFEKPISKEQFTKLLKEKKVYDL